MAGQAAGLDADELRDWSAQAESYNPRDFSDTLRSIKPDGGIGPGTLYRMAADYGWHADGKPQHATRTNHGSYHVEPPSSPAPARERKTRPGLAPADVWARCEPATNAHGYIVKKRAAGVPLDGLRVVPQGDALHIAGDAVAGFLAVPGYGTDGALQTIQFIPPEGKKLNLPGASMAGASFTVGERIDGQPLYVCEGLGTAWAIWQSTGCAAVVCFGWGNVRKVAEQLHQKDAHLVLVPDAGKETKAEEIARELSIAWVAMPEGSPSNFDAWDLKERDGPDSLAALLESAKVPEPPGPPLAVQFADELPTEFEAPDELIEGLLTAGAASILYGDSNCGKTFLAVDMACAVARGVEWLGRKTEPGLALYLAAESPQSIRSRLQAYQAHHGARVPDFAIVASPVNLFDNEADAAAIVQTVEAVARQRGKPVRLVVGDTLARLSAGANENSGEDMGRVVRRIDAIRAATGAHFLLIHHSGKVAANGARGWSGMRAAIDTEIEVTDTVQGRCAEITKQRDLGTKGERIGFRLESVALGFTKWGKPATSCVVLSADAPAKQQGKRVSEVGGAIAEFLSGKPAAVRKLELVRHFEGRYAKSAVYRELKKLVTAGAIHEAAGMVAANIEVRNGAD